MGKDLNVMRKINEEILKEDERAALALSTLYEEMGYKKLKVKKFEEYALYLENKNFLTTDNIITFTEPGGRLMALKADVTLSIAKNISAPPDEVTRIYYNENVYRLAKGSKEFKEISQIGLELIGDVDAYMTGEVTGLALDSLYMLSDSVVLDISHMGFIHGLIDNINVSLSVKSQIIECIKAKNIHDLKLLLADSPSDCEKLITLIGLCGDFNKTITAARELIINEQMERAINELSDLFDMLSCKFSNDELSGLMLDFSIINDIDYYNGIIFRGYIDSQPRAVLSGGRYDNLFERLDNGCKAMGFAVYLGELELTDSREYDVDSFILYSDNTDICKLQRIVKEHMQLGRSVFVQKQPPKNIRYKQMISVDE